MCLEYGCGWRALALRVKATPSGVFLDGDCPSSIGIGRWGLWRVLDLGTLLDGAGWLSSRWADVGGHSALPGEIFAGEIERPGRNRQRKSLLDPDQQSVSQPTMNQSHDCGPRSSGNLCDGRQKARLIAQPGCTLDCLG